MIVNDIEEGIKEVEAYYIFKKHSCDTYVKITSKNNKSINFTFNDRDFDPRNMKINEKIDLVKYIYWDVELVTNETYYLFDLTKDKLELTRLNDNLFKLEVKIENPDMIYSPTGVSFKNIIINTEFSFIYNEKKR